MEPVVMVTILGVALAVVAIAIALIAIARILAQVASRLDVVLTAVSAIPGKVAPAEDVLTQINGDLGEAQGLLEELLEKKAGRG